MPEGLPLRTSAEALKGIKMLNLRSRFGDLHLTFRQPDSPSGFADLIGRASEYVVHGLTVWVGPAAGRDFEQIGGEPTPIRRFRYLAEGVTESHLPSRRVLRLRDPRHSVEIRQAFREIVTRLYRQSPGPAARDQGVAFRAASGGP